MAGDCWFPPKNGKILIADSDGRITLSVPFTKISDISMRREEPFVDPDVPYALWPGNVECAINVMVDPLRQLEIIQQDGPAEQEISSLLQQ